MHELAHPIAATIGSRADRATAQIAVDIFRECGRRTVAALGLRVDRLEDQRIEIAAQTPGPADTFARRRQLSGVLQFCGSDARPRRTLAGDLLGEHLHATTAPVRQAPGGQLVEQHAEPVDVSGHSDFFTSHLFGCGIRWRQNAHAGGGLHQLIGVVAKDLGDAEIEQVRTSVGIDQHVAGLEIAVHDQLPMRVIDHPRDFRQQRQARIQAKRVNAHVVRQRFATDVVHRQIRATVGSDASVEQGRDRRMVELGKNPAFLQEALQQRLGVHTALEQLDRRGLHHIALVALRQPHLAHAAAAQEPLHAPARSELGIGLGGHWRQHLFALFQHALSARISNQQCTHLGSQRRIALGQLGQRQLLRRGGQVDQLVEVLRNFGPALRAQICTHRRNSHWQTVIARRIATKQSSDFSWQ